MKHRKTKFIDVQADQEGNCSWRILPVVLCRQRCPLQVAGHTILIATFNVCAARMLSRFDYKKIENKSI